MAVLSYVACLANLLALTLYKAWRFSLLTPLSIDSGFDCFDFVINIFIKNVFVVIFDVSITVRFINNITIIIIIINYWNCFEFFFIVQPLIAHSHQDRFFNLTVLTM